MHGKGWASNAPARRFMNELNDSYKRANLTANVVDTVKSDRPKLSPIRRQEQEKVHASNHNSNKTIPSSSSINNLGNLDGNEQPTYAYKETVRCKVTREGLPCYDCPSCRRFYQVLQKTGHDLSYSQQQYVLPPKKMQQPQVYSAIPKNGFGRHRALYPPAETPVDFWELDFIDEIPKNKASS